MFLGVCTAAPFILVAFLPSPRFLLCSFRIVRYRRSGFPALLSTPQRQPLARPADSHAVGRGVFCRASDECPVGWPATWLASWQAGNWCGEYEVQVYLPNQKLNPRLLFGIFVVARLHYAPLVWTRASECERDGSSTDTGTSANRAEIENPFDTSGRACFAFARHCVTIC